jgi:hypothetical protein
MTALTDGGLSASELARRALGRRGVEAVIWGIPAVYYTLLVEAGVKRLGGGFNDVLFWSGLAGWKNQTLTPNADCIYFLPFINTSDVGPVVLEIPPAQDGSITGSIDDCWQAALEDVGPAGADKGDGGRYLILPPDYVDDVPEGYFVLHSPTYQSFAILRSNLSDTTDETVAAAVDYGKRIQVYPLSAADSPTPTRFLDAHGTVVDTTIPYDDRFFAALNQIVQSEPWLTRDKAMINVLATVGIVKEGQFAPDASTRDALTEAAQEARAWLDTCFESAFDPPYFDHTHWAVPVPPAVIEGQSTQFADPNSYPLDGRGALYSMAYFSAKHLGAGQFYLMAIHDRNGRPLDGGLSYALIVPADPPVTRYWSATVYDRKTHVFLRDQDRLSCASNDQGVQHDADGSTTVYFGPHPPPAGKANWVPTLPGRGFEVMFRLYGPQPALFDKTWTLPDIVEVEQS